MPPILQPVIPSERDRSVARASSKTLARLIAQRDDVNLHTDGADAGEINLPASVVRLLQEILEQIGRGQPVMVLPVESDLTTSQAAEIVGVSRPFLIRLLEQGDLPFRKTGTHRRVRLRDVLAYKQKKLQQRAVLDDLVREAQELDMGY